MKTKEYYKKYYQKNSDKLKKKARYYYNMHKKQSISSVIKWKNNNKGKVKEYQKKSSKKVAKENREKVLEYYKIKCACCGENNKEFLGVDHINGGGTKHRKEISGKYRSIYEYLIRNNFPKGFRLLCHNCNMSIGFYGYCPHKKI